MDITVKNTFLQFNDGVVNAGNSGKVRAASADSFSSSSRSHASSDLSSASQFAQRGRQLREQLKVLHFSCPSPGLSSDASRTPHVIITSEAEQPLAAEHVVWESSNSSSSSLVFGSGTRRPTGGLESDFDMADKGTGNIVLADASSAEIFVSEDQSCVFRHPSVGSAKHASETCKPCHYLKSKSGCKLDRECGFCHYSHPKSSKTDLPKQQRDLCQLLLVTIHEGVAGNKKMAAAEEQLLRWIGEDYSRMGAYAVKACRCYQGECNNKPGVARLLRAATESRIRVKDAGDDEFSKDCSMSDLATEANEGGSVAESASWTRVSL